MLYCTQVAQKERPPMHEYIRKLLYKDLSKTTTEKVNIVLLLFKLWNRFDMDCSLVKANSQAFISLKKNCYAGVKTRSARLACARLL